MQYTEEVNSFHSSLLLEKTVNCWLSGMMMIHYNFQWPNSNRATHLTTGLSVMTVESRVMREGVLPDFMPGQLHRLYFYRMVYT